MAIDKEAIRARLDRERERQRESLEWFERRTTWAPKLTDEQKREQDEYIKKHNLPF